MAVSAQRWRSIGVTSAARLHAPSAISTLIDTNQVVRARRHLHAMSSIGWSSKFTFGSAPSEPSHGP